MPSMRFRVVAPFSTVIFWVPTRIRRNHVSHRLFLIPQELASWNVATAVGLSVVHVVAARHQQPSSLPSLSLLSLSHA